MSQVLTKISPNGKITLFMPAREFVDDLTHVQPIDGVVVVDPRYLEPDRMFAVQLMTVCRYGREDDEIMGLTLSKEFCLASIVVDKSPPPDRMTEIQKDVQSIYPDGCFPFHIEWPKGLGANMYVEQKATSLGKPCGMRYFLEVFALMKGDNRVHKRSSIQMDLSLIQMPPLAQKVQEGKTINLAASIVRPVLFSSGQVQLDVCLEKTFITDGDPIVLNVSLSNHSNTTVKRMKAELVQFYRISFSKGKRKQLISSLVTTDGFPVGPGANLNKTVILQSQVPVDKTEGIAVRTFSGKKYLASSTFFEDPKNPDTFGFIVSYMIRVKVWVQPTPLKHSIVAQVPVYLVAKPSNSMMTAGETRTRSLGLC